MSCPPNNPYNKTEMHLKQTWSFLLAACAALTACGGGDTGDNGLAAPGKILLDVKVSGLASGYTLVLQNNQSNDLTVPTNGRFAFPQDIVIGSTYSVTVKSQPYGHTCSVEGASTGTLTSSGALISIVCLTNGTLPPPFVLVRPPVQVALLDTLSA